MILSQELRSNWSLSSKILFRFVCLYFFLYVFNTFFGMFLQPLIDFVGRDILNLPGKLERFRTGSGDTTRAYVLLFINLMSAILGTLIWTFLDRKRNSYNQFLYWLLVLIRIYLIFYMFTYGFIKIFKTQFPGPSLFRLMQPLGEMSPMGLAWTYMGHSDGFNMFTGGMEVLSGLLLIPRRTKTFGAFITMGVMTHVAMMNLFYDIPVKLFSIHLILFAGFIFYTDIQRFVNVFFLNKSAKKLKYYRVSDDDHYAKLIIGLKIVITVLLVGSMSARGYSNERSFGDKRAHPALRGIWEVTTFVRDGDTLPPLTTNGERWRYLIVDRKERALIKMMNDSIKPVSFNVDVPANKVFLEANQGPDDVFTYTQDQDHLELSLDDHMGRNTLHITLKARDLSKIKLTNRGFHWINEYPYH